MKDYFLRNKLAKAWQFADAMRSRGIDNQKVSDEIKDIREISCHGSEELGLTACSERLNSRKYKDSHYCGACNCGDFWHTQINNLQENHYSKLDYPRVFCPKQMPGFSNYVPLTISENNMRKQLIEQTFGVEYLVGLNQPKETEK